MASIEKSNIPLDINLELKSILGQRCCRQLVGDDRSFFLGFGDVTLVKNPHGESQHGAWEIGTYRSAWRIIDNDSILCGSKEIFDSVDELRDHLLRLEGAVCINVEMLTAFDVRFVFGNGLIVDFLGTFGDDDELVHIFLPHGRVVSFSIQGGWISQMSSLA